MVNFSQMLAKAQKEEKEERLMRHDPDIQQLRAIKLIPTMVATDNTDLIASTINNNPAEAWKFIYPLLDAAVEGEAYNIIKEIVENFKGFSARKIENKLTRSITLNNDKQALLFVKTGKLQYSTIDSRHFKTLEEVYLAKTTKENKVTKADVRSAMSAAKTTASNLLLHASKHRCFETFAALVNQKGDFWKKVLLDEYKGKNEMLLAYQPPTIQQYVKQLKEYNEKTKNTQ